MVDYIYSELVSDFPVSSVKKFWEKTPQINEWMSPPRHWEWIKLSKTSESLCTCHHRDQGKIYKSELETLQYFTSKKINCQFRLLKTVMRENKSSNCSRNGWSCTSRPFQVAPPQNSISQKHSWRLPNCPRCNQTAVADVQNVAQTDNKSH